MSLVIQAPLLHPSSSHLTLVDPPSLHENKHNTTTNNPPFAPTEPQLALPVLDHVYGYKVFQEWIYKLAKDHNIGDRSKSAGVQFHFLQDPSDTDYGYRHCFTIATNWNPKKGAHSRSTTKVAGCTGHGGAGIYL